MQHRTSTHWLHGVPPISEHLQMCCNEILPIILAPNTYLYSISSHPIKSVDSHKDLGILMTSNLSWSKHINSICSITYKALHFTHHSISTTSPSLKLRIYLSLVHSKLSYCSNYGDPVWSRTSYVLKGFSDGPPSLFAMTSLQTTSPNYLCSIYSLSCTG